MPHPVVSELFAFNTRADCPVHSVQSDAKKNSHTCDENNIFAIQSVHLADIKRYRTRSPAVAKESRPYAYVRSSASDF